MTQRRFTLMKEGRSEALLKRRRSTPPLMKRALVRVGGGGRHAPDLRNFNGFCRSGRGPGGRWAEINIDSSAA